MFFIENWLEEEKLGLSLLHKFSYMEESGNLSTLYSVVTLYEHYI